MQLEQRRQLADLLITARRGSRQVASMPAELMPADHAEAYALNALVAAGLGWEPLGWKIAGTNPVMQQRLGTPDLICGRTFRRFLVESPAALVHAELLDPIVECEIFFRLGADLPARLEPYIRSEVDTAVAAMHAGIEVAECRFPLAALPAMPAIVADGAASGRYVLGPEIKDWRSSDIAAMPVSLTVDGVVRRSGYGRDVMGHPLNALLWLANRRRTLGDGLAAGEIVSTGTLTGMLLARPGQRMLARFGTQHEVAVAFA